MSYPNESIMNQFMDLREKLRTCYVSFWASPKCSLDGSRVKNNGFRRFMYGAHGTYLLQIVNGPPDPLRPRKIIDGPIEHVNISERFKGHRISLNIN